MDDQKLQFLDDFEGYPQYYNRLKVPVKISHTKQVETTHHDTTASCKNNSRQLDDGSKAHLNHNNADDGNCCNNKSEGSPSTSDEVMMYECTAYFLTDYKEELLSLPFIEEYDSYGSHGLPYTERLDRSAQDEADTVWREVKYV